MPNRNGPGFFLTLEGIDGAGKSSHLPAVKAFFVSRGHSVVMTREPGGTPLAEALRTMLLSDSMDPMTETLLVFAARRDHLSRVVVPALQRDAIVVCDRFTDSTFAYQGGGRSVPVDMLHELEGRVQGGLQPDLTLWFDISPETAAGRLEGARSPDRFEQQPVDFFRQVRSAYESRSRSFADRFLRIDAEGKKDEIWREIESVLSGVAARLER